jgi:ribosomal protein S18 acetylase RimI-like enzyme
MRPAIRIRAFVQDDLPRLTELTIDTFGPYYEDQFRPMVGDVVFANQHGSWRDDYRTQVAALHDPSQHKYVAVGETEGAVAGYVAWTVDPARGNGSVTILAVSVEHRRQHAGIALCEHAFDQMRAHGAEVVEIGTGGDPFHAPARALYEKLGCVPVPVTVYYRQL